LGIVDSQIKSPETKISVEFFKILDLPEKSTEKVLSSIRQPTQPIHQSRLITSPIGRYGTIGRPESKDFMCKGSATPSPRPQWRIHLLRRT
jgi:hypothetical protein